LKRQRTREICDPDKDECAGYGAELRCLAKALRNGSCSDVECERRVRDALYSVLLQQCNQYCKARSAYNDVADVLTPMQRRLAKQACAPPPGPADIDMNY
jgi:hypothetical protein